MIVLKGSSATLKMTIFMTWQASKWRFWVDFENDLKLAQNKIFPKTKSIVVHCIRRSTTEKKLRVKKFWVVKSIGGFYRDSLLRCSAPTVKPTQSDGKRVAKAMYDSIAPMFQSMYNQSLAEALSKNSELNFQHKTKEDRRKDRRDQYKRTILDARVHPVRTCSFELSLIS